MESAHELLSSTSSSLFRVIGGNGEELSDADKDLLAGIDECNVAAVERALQNGADGNRCYRRGGGDDATHVATFLWLACVSGYEDDDRPKADEIVRILLKAGANARWKDRDGCSAIYYACTTANRSIVERLLNHDNGLLEIADNEGETPLFPAMRNQQTDIVQLLLDRGANVHATDSRGCTPFFNAVYREQTDMLQLMLDRGVNVHATEADGTTPLMAAVESIDAVRQLLAAGSDLDSRDDFQQTVLHHAAFTGSIDAVRALIVEHNANMLAEDKHGDTPFDSAVFEQKDDVVNYLLQLYGNKVTEYHGRFALHAILCTAEYWYPDDDEDWHPPMVACVRILLPMGLLTSAHLHTLLHSLDTEQICKRDKSGNLPIHIACEANAPVEVVSMLVDMDPATLHIADRTGSLPIHLLCNSRTTPTEYASVCYLVEQEGGVGTLAARNHNGSLPLHNLLASTDPSVRTVQYLIQSFPKAVTARTKDGLYPFMVAACESSSASLSVIYQIVRADPNLILQNED